VSRRFTSTTAICLLACTPRPSQPRSSLAEANGVIDRFCRVYPADTLTLAEAHERYGIDCSPIVDPEATPQYQSSRPTGDYARLTLVLYGVRRDSTNATLQRVGTDTILQARHMSGQDSGIELFFDSVPPGTYTLTAKVGRKRHSLGSFEIRLRELWEFWYVPSADR